MINLFEAENFILEALDGILPTGAILPLDKVEQLNNRIMEAKGGTIISVINLGYSADKVHNGCGTRNNDISALWRVTIVTKREDYKATGGTLFVDMVKRILNFETTGSYSKFILVNDERDFNNPLFDNDVVYIPSLFRINSILY